MEVFYIKEREFTHLKVFFYVWTVITTYLNITLSYKSKTLKNKHRIIIPECDLLTAYDDFVNKNQQPARKNGEQIGE